MFKFFIKEWYLSNAAMHNGGLCGLIVLLSKFNEFPVEQSDIKKTVILINILPEMKRYQNKMKKLKRMDRNWTLVKNSKFKIPLIISRN